MVIFMPQVRDFIQSGLHPPSPPTPSVVIHNRPVTPVVVEVNPPKKLPPPGWLDRKRDPSPVTEHLWHPIQDAISEAKPDVQRQAERLVFDSREREITRERFQSRHPWEGSESSFVIPSNQIHSTGVLQMIW